MNPENNDGPDRISMNKPISRRQALKLVGVGGGWGILMLVGGCTGPGSKPLDPTQAPTAEVKATPTAKPPATPEFTNRPVLVANAQGMVVAQPTRCVGCRRCELACTEFNDGKAQPSIARIKVGRNYNFGPQGARLGFWHGEGAFGNHRIVQETCRQCPHPVPCQLVCPNNAIEVVPPVNARVVNTQKCTGCRTCQEACPWEMTSFDQELKKATKCSLCNGKPECVAACPTGALQYVPWEDTTRAVPRRFVVPAYIQPAPGVQETCVQCHK